MDTQTTKATQREAELRRQINALYRRTGEIEIALQKEHIAQERIVARRKELVKELPGADLALEAWTNSELDKLDEVLKFSIRTAEGLKSSHDRVVNEIASLDVELAEVTRIAGQQKRAAGISALRTKVQENVNNADKALADAREALATLNVLVSRGIEEYGIEAQAFVGPVLEEFRHRQFNPESYGWLLSRGSANLRFMVAPMVKASTPR
jgi:chromosome segregation ATPase